MRPPPPRSPPPRRLLLHSLLLPLLFSLAAGASAAASSRCAALDRAHDGLLLVDIQNCFMERRPLPAATRYPVPAEELERTAADGGALPHVRAGPLQVNGSAEIVPVANEWIAAAAAGGVHTIYTLDWHPPDHCSFCDIANGGIAAPSFCLAGSLINRSSHCRDADAMRCRDAVSVRDWELQQYHQWASHCVAGEFGARLDPVRRRRRQRRRRSSNPGVA